MNTIGKYTPSLVATPSPALSTNVAAHASKRQRSAKLEQAIKRNLEASVMHSDRRQKETPEPINRKRLRKVLRGEQCNNIRKSGLVKPNLCPSMEI